MRPSVHAGNDLGPQSTQSSQRRRSTAKHTKTAKKTIDRKGRKDRKENHRPHKLARNNRSRKGATDAKTSAVAPVWRAAGAVGDGPPADGRRLTRAVRARERMRP